jgi:hypothetical protein
MTLKIANKENPGALTTHTHQGLSIVIKVILLGALIPFSRASQPSIYNENMKKQVFLTCLHDVSIIYPYNEDMVNLTLGQNRILNLAECIDAIPDSMYPEEYIPTRSLSQDRIHSIFAAFQDYLAKRQPSIQAWIKNLIHSIKP